MLMCDWWIQTNPLKHQLHNNKYLQIDQGGSKPATSVLGKVKLYLLLKESCGFEERIDNGFSCLLEMAVWQEGKTEKVW